MPKPKPFRIYLSHCIRGKHGEDATDTQMAKNNQRAHEVAEQLRSYFLDWYRMDNFPEVEIYVPGEMDEFVLHAYRRGYLTEKQILDCDCDIIDGCDMVLALGNYVSRGMAIEIEHASTTDKPVFQFSYLRKSVIRDLFAIIESVADLR